MRRVLLDSSFLLGITELSVGMEELISIYPKAELITTKSVIRELEKLAERKRGAKVAMEVVRGYGVRVLEEFDREADEDIVRAAKELGCAVATFDLELKNKLLREGIPVVYLRAKKKLILEDPSKLSEEY
jgi:rRNA-processing protein FCF1